MLHKAKYSHVKISMHISKQYAQQLAPDAAEQLLCHQASGDPLLTSEYLHLRLHPAEYYHFRFATRSIKIKIYEYDFVCSFIWVWN
jgi:hypothetical protein